MWLGRWLWWSVWWTCFLWLVHLFSQYCRRRFKAPTCLNSCSCPQPTPHVSPSPSLHATMDGASTLTGAVIMVSVYSFSCLCLCLFNLGTHHFPLPQLRCACFAVSLMLAYCTLFFSSPHMFVCFYLYFLSFVGLCCWFCCFVLCRLPTLLSPVGSVFQKRIVGTALMSWIVQTWPVSA